MIGRKMLSWAMVATYGIVAVASSQLMLCFHRDGRSQMELAALLCCETRAESAGRDCRDGCSESPSAPCPDDQCHDIPVTIVAPQVLSPVPALDLADSVVDFFLADLSNTRLRTPVAPIENSSHSRDHPPESGSKDFLRTVILRL